MCTHIGIILHVVAKELNYHNKRITNKKKRTLNDIEGRSSSIVNLLTLKTLKILNFYLYKPTLNHICFSPYLFLVGCRVMYAAWLAGIR